MLSVVYELVKKICKMPLCPCLRRSKKASLYSHGLPGGYVNRNTVEEHINVDLEKAKESEVRRNIQYCCFGKIYIFLLFLDVFCVRDFLKTVHSI